MLVRWNTFGPVATAPPRPQEREDLEHVPPSSLAALASYVSVCFCVLPLSGFKLRAKAHSATLAVGLAALFVAYLVTYGALRYKLQANAMFYACKRCFPTGR